ncbi:MAG: hypothetical protein GF411_03385 [Candidatus Lokiarchaeota archaeon]|nr:hypothetical protein [Candidatus Lokiarchaeota archaeon]
MESEFDEVDPNTLNVLWKKTLPSEITRWAIFKYGTIVLCRDSERDVEEYALEIIEKWAPMAPGTPLGDFSVGSANNIPGWIVSYYHEDIGNYIAPEEIDEEEPSILTIGLLGRAKRVADYDACEIVHIEK